MADQELISGLIETYRLLNTNLRGLDETRLRAAHNGSGSIRDVMRRLRDDELQFSQALKQRVTGVSVADLTGGDDRPTTGLETAQDTTAMLIAQFGTARESTLAMLRDLPDTEWDADAGGKSIRNRVVDLLDNDRHQLDRIKSLLSA
jgi:hypothetical protein